MKQLKKFVLPLLLICCFLMSTLQVVAANELLGTVVDGSVLTDDMEAEDTVYPRQRGSYLSSGSGHIVLAGTGKVTISGNTAAYQNVDEIKVTLYLQRLENGQWVHVATLGPKTNYNTNYVSNSKTYSVTRGYYYRVTGGHTVIKGSKSEALTSATNALWVP